MNLISYPRYWQTPAKTEMQTYESFLVENHDVKITYVAFPWATLIDSLCTWSSSKSSKLLFELANLKVLCSDEERIATVCQHIRCLDFLELFKGIGITDIFWTHKTIKLDMVDNIKFHPFSLFPAQTYDLPTDYEKNIPSKSRTYLANFIGAYNPDIYLTNVRECILNDIGKYDDILIIKRDAWHFDRHVYKEQLAGISIDDQQKNAELNQKNEYLNAIKNSIFTLCPTGSGPNSIRIFESIDLLSIPVIISKDLDLYGSRKLWEQSCVFVKDSKSGYRESLKIIRQMSSKEINQKLYSLKKLRDIISPNRYATHVVDYFHN